MCNAWNHTPDCICGWGGTGHLGRRVLGADANDRAGFWWVPPITRTRESYVIPNAACPVCGALVFFYQSPSGGRVFFDELGPPWPKHPCTNNTSIPKSLNVSSGAERISNSSWNAAGWSPFFISEVLNIYKSVLVIKGTVEGKLLTVFIRKNSHTATSRITEQSISFLRRGLTGNFELSVLMKSCEHFTISAFFTLFKASGTAIVSSTKNPPTNKTLQPVKKNSTTGIDRKIAAISSSQVGTTKGFQTLLENFAMMTPEQKGEVKRYHPEFHKVASIMAPRMRQVLARREKSEQRRK